MATGEQQTLATAIDAATQIGAVALTVADLERSLTFYTEAMGYGLIQRTPTDAVLGVANTPLLLLKEQAGARPWPTNGVTGLYHFATLVPSRADLGRWLLNYVNHGYDLPGQGDHNVSEALYLSDPDGHGIEVYRDRPRSDWRWRNGLVQMGTGPVDIDGVVRAAQQDNQPWTGLAAGTRVGHVHLQVGDITQAEAFYHGVLGFDVVAKLPSALFVSAGGYHHHLGLNVWHSRGGSPAPADTARLRWYSVELPNEDARAAAIARIKEAGIDVNQQGAIASVRDPWQNLILLQSGTLSASQAAVALA